MSVALILLACWVVHDFVDAVLAAGVTAVASWPAYQRFRGWLPRRTGSGLSATLFTLAISALVLVPLAIAAVALVGEARVLLTELAAADGRGSPPPAGLVGLPIVGPWLAEHWRSGTLHTLTDRAQPSMVLGWVQALGQFTARQALTVAFSILLLGFFYRQGAQLERSLRTLMRRFVGEQSERYIDVATRAVRASATSMLAVAAFDTLAAGLAYALAGVPRAWAWAAITGSLAAVPFLGYAAVAAMVLQLAVQGAATPALLALCGGCLVLLLGDKLVRPMVARGGIRLPFVWVLMGCIGGFGVLGPAGIVIGPLALALAREACQRGFNPAPRQANVPAAPSPAPQLPACDR